MKELTPSWFSSEAVVCARELLGKVISYDRCSGMIVETEAYMNDSASHGYKITPRSEIMLTTYGHVYIYLIYGMYYCLNFTTNKGSVGAVLIRALEPLSGIEHMKKRRKTEDLGTLLSGPGKVCTAFGITTSLNGGKIGEHIKVFDSKKKVTVGVSKRIGISTAQHLDWRFFIPKNPYVSKR